MDLHVYQFFSNYQKLGQRSVVLSPISIFQCIKMETLQAMNIPESWVIAECLFPVYLPSIPIVLFVRQSFTINKDDGDKDR